jgi:hypothetical protein
MIRVLLFILALVMPVSAWAAEFTATVDNNNVTAGDSLTLQLNLSGADAKSDPETSALKQNFTISSEGQSSSTTIINGKVNSTTGWQLTIIPRQQGQVIIPPVTLETSAGTLSSQPITIDVGASTASSPTQKATAGTSNVTITAEADDTEPYQGQPVQYTVRVIAHANVTDLSLGDLTADNAVIEQQGKPEISDQVENGIPVKVAKFHYLVTPVHPGKVTISPVVLQGSVAVRDDRFNRRFGLNDPLGMLQGMEGFPGLDRLKPFSVASNAVTLDVKPPAVEMNPWLPLHSLDIRDDIDSGQTLKVGEPVTRKVMILANGTVGSQLPNLEPQENHTDFKVYADKATTGQDIDKKTGLVFGWRKETYSLIPQKSGKLVLPAIKVSWWDLANHRVATAEVPEKVLTIVPNTASVPAPEAAPSAAEKPSQMPVGIAPVSVAMPKQKFPLLYGVVLILVIALLFMFLWIFSLQRKLHSALSGNAVVAKAPEEKPLSKPAGLSQLHSIQKPDDLLAFIQSYAHQNWKTPEHATLETIFASLEDDGIDFDRNAAYQLIKKLTSSLYAGKSADIDQLKNCFSTVLGSLEKKERRASTQKLSRLNPS